MSSDSEFDEGHVKKEEAPDSDSDEEKKERRPARSKASKQVIESDSSSGSDSEEDVKPSSSRKRKASSSKAAAQKRGRGRDGDDDIRGSSGLDFTQEEKDRLLAMTELEREQEIFKLMEEQEAKKIRMNIQRRLAAEQTGEVDPDERGRDKKKKRGLSSSGDSSRSEEEEEKKEVKKAKKKVQGTRLFKTATSDEDDDVRVNPSEAHKKKMQKSAMEDLRNKRKEKEAKKASLSVDGVFGKKRSSSTSSSSSSSDSSRSSSPSSRSSSPRRTASPTPEELILRRPVDTVQELMMARISRWRLAKFVYAPFFKNLVVDGYVRVGTGPTRATQNYYRIAQVVDVVETAKVYDLENQRTNKGLRLKFGEEERVYRLEFVSNSHFTEAEFAEWRDSMKTNKHALPTMRDMQKKLDEINKAMNHDYKNGEIDEMLAEKKRFKHIPRNFAVSKGELMRKLEEAKQTGNHVEVQRLQSEIMEIDQKADELDKRRSGDISAIDWINKRNRNLMKEQFLGGKKSDVDMSKEDDPFTRKSGKMKMVSGTARNSSATNLADLNKDNTASPLASSASGPKSTPVPPPLPRPVLPPPVTDLASLHKVKIDIDVDDLDIRTSGPVEEPVRVPVPTASSGKGRPLSLEDYRKRRAEMAKKKEEGK